MPSKAKNPVNKKPPKRNVVYKSVLNMCKKLKIAPDAYKKQYKTSSTEHWLKERQKLRTAHVQMLKYKKHRQKNPHLLHHLVLNTHRTEHTSMRKGDLRVNAKVHTVPLALQLSIGPGMSKKIERQINHVIRQHLPKKIKQKDNIRRQLDQAITKKRRVADGTMYRLHIEDRKGKHMSTHVMRSPTSALHHLMRTHIIPKAASYLVGEFQISKITFSTIKSSKMCGFTRSLKQAHEKWHIVDPLKARTQCVFHSIATCRNYKKSPCLLDVTAECNSKRADSASNLKDQLNKKRVKDGLPPIDKGGDDSDLQVICDYVKTPMVLYNNLFEKIKTYEPVAYNYSKTNPTKKYFFNDTPLYELQRVGNHCLALINKKDVVKAFPDFDFHKFKDDAPETTETDIMIQKWKKPHTFNDKIAAWDIETSKDGNNVHVPYACGIAWMDDHGVQVEKQFWGLDCMTQFLDFLSSGEFNGYTMYAHNGGKYDINLLMKYALLDNKFWALNGTSCIELNNAWIGFEIKEDGNPDHQIKFKDSLRMLPMGLEKLCKELKVEHQKLTETVSHDDITLTNYHTFPDLPKYLSHDCRGLLEVMLSFNKEVFDALAIDVTTCFTGASLSKQTFFRNYYKFLGNHARPVYTLSTAHDEFIRDGYFGGRVECFKMGKIEGVFYYDFTSLYPFCGLQHLPYGEPEEVTFNGANKIDPAFFGFVKCRARTKDTKAIPKHAVLQNNRLTFPVFATWTELDIFSQEIDYDMYEYQFDTGLKFKKATFMAKFFADGFNRKATAKAEGKPAMAQAWKIIINSGYGFWGLRISDRDGVEIFEADSDAYLEYLNSEKMISMNEHDNGTMFCRVLKTLKVKDFNVGVAAAIASYSRLKLHQLLTDIRAVGGEIYYCDTDSVICNINLNDHPDLKEEHQWDGDGSELGSLKNECDEVVQKKLEKLYPDDESKQDSAFNALVAAENGNLSFDEGIITGCKQYALRKTITVDGTSHEIEILKCKGYSQNDKKLNYADFKTLSDGGTFKQKQMQFRCPKSNYVSQTDAFTIKTQYVDKTFRQVYTKGVVLPDGTVVPHKI